MALPKKKGLVLRGALNEGDGKRETLVDLPSLLRACCLVVQSRTRSSSASASASISGVCNFKGRESGAAVVWLWALRIALRSVWGPTGRPDSGRFF